MHVAMEFRLMIGLWGYFVTGQVLIWASAHSGKVDQLDGQSANGTKASPLEVTLGSTEAPLNSDRCRGYYDVMGQWDPPFNCNAGTYLYCCGTCGYRFCCEFQHDRLDQSTCTNYDTPNWANTGTPPVKVDDTIEDPEKDKTNMIVYIICGVVAIMVLVGIFTKLGLEKARGPQTEMNMSRPSVASRSPSKSEVNENQGENSPLAGVIPSTMVVVVGGQSSPLQKVLLGPTNFRCFINDLATVSPRFQANSMKQSRALTDLLKQQGHPTTDYIERDGNVGTVQVPITEGLTPRLARNSTDQPHLNNASVASPSVSQMGLPHPHNNILQRMASAPLQGQEYSKYATLKAVAETVADDFYSKRYPVMDLPPSGTIFPGVAHHQKDRQAGDACGFMAATPGQKTKVSKMNTHPLFNSSYKGWDQSQPMGRRHMYAGRRQYSIEHLPEIFSPPLHYKQPQRHLSTNSKTEVTV